MLPAVGNFNSAEINVAVWKKNRQFNNIKRIDRLHRVNVKVAFTKEVRKFFDRLNKNRLSPASNAKKSFEFLQDLKLKQISKNVKKNLFP